MARLRLARPPPLLDAREDGVRNRPMPASAPAVASNPAQNAAADDRARRPGAIGRKKPIAMQARQVRIRKTAFAPTLTAPRLARGRAQACIPEKREGDDCSRRSEWTHLLFLPPSAWQTDARRRGGAPVAGTTIPKNETPVQVAAAGPPDEAVAARACPASSVRNRWRRGARATGSKDRRRSG